MHRLVLLTAVFFAATPYCPSGEASSNASRVAFLVPLGDLGPEATAALELARRTAGAVLLTTDGHGRFESPGGKTESLESFRAIWIHEGDAVDRLEPLRAPASLNALRRHLEEGRALFLSGAAFALLPDLGVESVKPRRIGGGHDGYAASIVPVDGSHPVFRGLGGGGVNLDPSVGGNPREFGVPITDAGFPVSADFAGTGGPRGGHVLARAASVDENPLVEYAAGRGRVIALGWRLPHYALVPNAHRKNLERLTTNIIAYLKDPAVWQTVEATESEPPPSTGAPDAEWESLELAIRDLIATFGDGYPLGPDYLDRLAALRTAEGDAAQALAHLRDEALLANPLLDFPALLLVDRSAGRLGLPANFHGNSDIPATGYDNRIAVLSPVRPPGELRTLYAPEGGRFVGDVDLHFDGRRILFSMPQESGRWGLFEMAVDDPRPTRIPLIDEPDLDNFDGCYLPDGRIVFSSTATFVGVPCVNGSSHVTNLYLRSLDGSIRQLTFDQDHDWCPTVLNDGRVLYLRWEYSGLPHSNSRILFRMNPDGTDQKEYYGTNSYFPNSFFYARPVPGHPTQVMGIATGHHGTARSGRLLVLDPGVGHVESEGVVQEIPGRGRIVPARIFDNLVDGVWPQFLHPYPLSEKYVLVACKPTPSSPWGVYLVDVFDNRVLIQELPGRALLEPIPLRRTPLPPRIPDRVDPSRSDATVFLSDVYAGDGLRGIPRGTVKQLRLFAYHFSYRGTGGLLGAVGMDGPWDVKRVLGTVPVAPDGSAFFRVPANTPISVQPLDSDGRALQVMRSWFTAMPGEELSCVGCHERQGATPAGVTALAARHSPAEIEPWYGPTRGFAFSREVQPVLDRHCVRCHDGESTTDYRRDSRVDDWRSKIAGSASPGVGGQFSTAYAELQRFVRRPGIESDIHRLSPMDFHASTTELVQLLEGEHGGVKLDREDWDRIVTWIDLNAPYHGTWSEIAGDATVRPMALRRREMSRRYAGLDEDPEAIPTSLSEPKPSEPVATSLPTPVSAVAAAPSTVGKRLPVQRVELAPGITMELVHVPLEEPFWIGRTEITNEEYAVFDPLHDSHVEPMHGYQFGIHGYPLNGPKQPVVRVSWNEAMAFCRWLSERTGRELGLPTETQWEYACRAGTSTPFWFGDADTDFAPFANLGDARLREFALDTYIRVRLVPSPNRYDDWIPKDDRFDDGGLVSLPVASYRPNPWGLHDMHGNVWEWTRSEVAGSRVVRGGSWYDRPHRCRSSSRLCYKPYQPVFNVGFRVVAEH